MKEEYEDRIVHRADSAKRAKKAQDWVKEISLSATRSSNQSTIEPRRMNFWQLAVPTPRGQA